MEEAGVERLEDLVEIVVVANRGEDALAASRLPNLFGLPRDGFRGDMAAIAVGVDWSYRLLVELGLEDVRDGAVDALGSGFQKIGEADVELAFAQANGCVERGKAAETDIERRNWSARAKVSILLFKDWNECGGHALTERLTRRTAMRFHSVSEE